jgi:hypothetical protein
MKRLEKYTEGLEMEQFKGIDDISHYNFNYYIGLNNDLLFCKSDDDNTSEWWVISGENSYYLGESYCSDGEKLNRYETRCI